MPVSMNDSQALTIVAAVADDVPTILSFIGKLAEYEKLAHEVEVSEAMLREHLFGARPCAEVILARLRGEPVGFALFFQTYSTFVGRPGIWLEDVFVLADHRGKGVGRALLRHVAALAVERNCGRMEWSVLDWNEPAIRFYRELGARPMGDWTTQRLTGEALMRLAGRE
jgi:GNAT superfamily N-acetyltransferase